MRLVLSVSFFSRRGFRRLLLFLYSYRYLTEPGSSWSRKKRQRIRTVQNNQRIFSFLSLSLLLLLPSPLFDILSSLHSTTSLPIVPFFVHEKMRWKNPCTAVRDAWPERRCCSCRFKFSFSVCKLINETLIFLPPRVTLYFPLFPSYVK